MKYVGRFAPSPTGPLHEGSLLTAVASFLHARQARGEWLLRIEDVDPPREVPGAASSILKTLEALDLQWDRPVLYQSTRFDAYASVAERLRERGAAFLCSCSRRDVLAEIAQRGKTGGYPGTCRDRSDHPGPTALRMRVDSVGETIRDALQGELPLTALTDLGDFVIRRRDGLPAYHLAVVVDDAFQGVTSIVRGYDLLESTAAQRFLQNALGLPAPSYFHVPVLTNRQGEKLSKQTGAPAADAKEAGALAVKLLSRLGAQVPDDLRGARPALLWDWALAHWRIDALKGVTALRDDSTP